jgi:hypothetical protein
MLTTTSAATTCIKSSLATIARGAPGIMNGVANESTRTMVAKTRKFLTGRLVNHPSSANNRAPASARTKELKTSAPKVTGAWLSTMFSGIGSNAEATR